METNSGSWQPFPVKDRRGRLRLEECRQIFGGDVRNEVSEAVYFQDDAAQCAFINRFGTGSGEADVVGDLVAETVGLDSFGQVGCNRRENIAGVKGVAAR